MRQLFESEDKNGSGSLDSQEVEQLLEKLKIMTSEQSGGSFAGADAIVARVEAMEKKLDQIMTMLAAK